jgi:hypothetical protein
MPSRPAASRDLELKQRKRRGKERESRAFDVQ